MRPIIVHPHENVAATLSEAAVLFAQHGLGVVPTETFYGIAARADSAVAVGKIAALKQRDNDPARKAIALLADTLETVVNHFVLEWPLSALASHFWPGPLTMALQPQSQMLPELTAQDGTVGVRVSASPLTCRLAAAAGGLMTATSANLAHGQPCVDVRDLAEGVREYVDFIVDDGPCQGGAPSTVMGLRENRVVVYRSGAISNQSLANVLGYGPSLYT